MSAEIRSPLRKYIFRSAYNTEVNCGYNFIRNNINNVEDKQKLCIWKTVHHIGHIYSHISYWENALQFKTTGNHVSKFWHAHDEI